MAADTFRPHAIIRADVGRPSGIEWPREGSIAFCSTRTAPAGGSSTANLPPMYRAMTRGTGGAEEAAPLTAAPKGANGMDTPPTMDAADELGQLIGDLHGSEINGEISWFYDGVWRVRLGDEWNGYQAEETFNTLSKTAEWLRRKAVEIYPDSDFAKDYRHGLSEVTETGP